MTRRLARIIGAATAAVVSAFIVVFVAFGAPSTLPTSAVVGSFYLVAAAAVLLAPQTWAVGTAGVTAAVTGLLGLGATSNNLVDGLILLTAAAIEGAAAWAMRRD